MAPILNLFKWDANQMPQATPVIVKMENPSFSVVEIGGADAAFKPVEKSRARLRNAAQVRWLLLLRAHRAAACAASLLAAATKRLARADVASEKMGKAKLMLKIIKLLLLASLAALAFEAAAHYKYLDIEGIYAAWFDLRRQYIAPLIQYLSMFCVVLFMIQSLDRLILCLGCFYIKFKNIKPTAASDGDPFRAHHDYPMVLVQVPMCNEREV